jgi:hypothetical protein
MCEMNWELRAQLISLSCLINWEVAVCPPRELLFTVTNNVSRTSRVPPLYWMQSMLRAMINAPLTIKLSVKGTKERASVCYHV